MSAGEARRLPSFAELRTECLPSLAEDLESIVEQIDAVLPRGFAEKHPVVIAGALQANAVLALAQALVLNGERLADNMAELAEEVGSLAAALKERAGA